MEADQDGGRAGAASLRLPLWGYSTTGGGSCRLGGKKCPLETHKAHLWPPQQGQGVSHRWRMGRAPPPPRAWAWPRCPAAWTPPCRGSSSCQAETAQKGLTGMSPTHGHLPHLALLMVQATWQVHSWARTRSPGPAPAAHQSLLQEKLQAQGQLDTSGYRRGRAHGTPGQGPPLKGKTHTIHPSLCLLHGARVFPG